MSDVDNDTPRHYPAVIYWISTCIVAFVLGAGGIADLLRVEAVVMGMRQLGYPDYVCTIIGFWKGLGCIVIVAPGLPLLKEWAYAGAFFNLTGAAASHLAAGDPPAKTIVIMAFVMALVFSWWTRPKSRRLHVVHRELNLEKVVA